MTDRINLDQPLWDQSSFTGDKDLKVQTMISSVVPPRPVPIFRLDVQPHERAGGQPDPGGGQAAAGAVQGGHGAPGHHGDTGDT